MPFELQEVSFADGEQIAYVYISAFFDDPFMKTLYPGVPFEKQVAGAMSRWPTNYGDISSHYKKVIDTVTGNIVGYSKWSFANTDALGELKKPTGDKTSHSCQGNLFMVI